MLKYRGWCDKVRTQLCTCGSKFAGYRKGMVIIMEEGKNIPLIIMLSAGSIISVACILYEFSLLATLSFVLATLVVFYVTGLIVKRIIVSINHEAEERAALLAQEEAETKQKEVAEQEEIKTQNLSVDENGGLSFE